MMIDATDMGIRIIKKNERHGTLVSLMPHNPECEHCIEPQKACKHCDRRKESNDKTSYILTIQYDDTSQIKDEFNDFYSAFDSFSNIIKTLISELEEK